MNIKLVQRGDEDYSCFIARCMSVVHIYGENTPSQERGCGNCGCTEVVIVAEDRSDQSFGEVARCRDCGEIVEQFGWRLVCM